MSSFVRALKSTKHVHK